MGMYDTVRCSLNIGPEFENECQTKELDRWGGTMSHFWIDPQGYLWHVDYHGTSELVPKADVPPNKLWEVFKRIRTGARGRVKPFYLTDYVTIYPANWEGRWEYWPAARLHIVNGKVISFVTNTNGDNNA